MVLSLLVRGKLKETSVTDRGDDTVVLGSLRDLFGATLRLQPPIVLRRRDDGDPVLW
jgi:hypothetical protein